MEDGTPELKLTSEASEKLHQVIDARGPSVIGLRLQIVGRAQGEFQHVLSMVEDPGHVESDVPVEADGITVYLEGQNIDYLDGVEIHFVDKGAGQSGLEFTNPNPIWLDERELAIQEIFDRDINPAIAAHGGIVHLLGVRETTAYVQMGGGCQGCGMADVTLKQGIEATILDRVKGIDRVMDETDHDAGQNPYYRPSKK